MTLKLPLEVEPAGRALTGAPLRWRLHPMFEPGFIPLGFYRELEGLVWDCPDCGTAGALVLRFKRIYDYEFRCRNCRRKTQFSVIEGDRLGIALGAPVRRNRPPEIKAWLDEDLTPRYSIDGKEGVVDMSVQLAGLDIDMSAKLKALEEERRARES